MRFVPFATQLWVRAAAVDSNLRFLGATTILVRYLKHTRDAQRADDKRKMALKGVEANAKTRSRDHQAPPAKKALKAWRADGSTEIDAELFEFKDAGPAAPRVEGGAEMCLAQLVFRGDKYTADFSDPEKRRCNSKAQALFEAFLEHETIQVEVSMENSDKATLALKLGLIYQMQR